MMKVFYRREQGGDHIPRERRFVLHLIMDGREWVLLLRWNEVYGPKRIFHYPFHKPVFSRHLMSTEFKIRNTKGNSTIDFIASHKVFLADHDFGKY